MYVLRCFHGAAVAPAKPRSRIEAVADGAFDRPASQRPIILCVAGVSTQATPSEPRPSRSSRRLNERIERVLTRRDMPGGLLGKKSTTAGLGRYVDGTGGKDGVEVVQGGSGLGETVFEWIYERWFPNHRRAILPAKSIGRWRRSVFWVSLATMGALLAWSALRALRKGGVKTVAIALPALPDLLAEDVEPDALPEAQWSISLASMRNRGDLQLALRAAWLACLAHLGQRELLRLARFKSSYDYQRELRRRARTDAELLAAFGENRPPSNKRGTAVMRSRRCPPTSPGISSGSAPLEALAHSSCACARRLAGLRPGAAVCAPVEHGDIYPPYSISARIRLGRRGCMMRWRPAARRDAEELRPIVKLRTSGPATLIYAAPASRLLDEDELRQLERMVANRLRVVITFFPCRDGSTVAAGRTGNRSEKLLRRAREGSRRQTGRQSSRKDDPQTPIRRPKKRSR